MQDKKNVAEVVKEGLCCSCGVCAASCHKKAIKLQYGKRNNLPIVNTDKCVHCSLCYDVCPGKGLPIFKVSSKLFEREVNIIHNKYCGYYLNSYVGYSTDENIRFHSASGGLVTSLSCYLLRNNIIEGAVVVGYKQGNPFEPKPFIAKTEEEIKQSRSSKYIVVSYDEVLDEITTFNKPIVVVGLPCHIQGVRNLADKNKKIRDCIKGYFAIYCSLTKTKNSIDYYLYRYGINKKKVGRFSFRDDGCLGYMKYEKPNGEVIKRIPYLKYWHGTHSFFVNERCSVCTDHFGELADISFGDINIEPYNKDKTGISSVVSRSSYWREILLKAETDGHLKLDEISIEEVISSQQYSKKYKKGAGIQSAMTLRRLLGKKNPEYDIEFEGIVSCKSILIEVTKLIQRFVGKHRSGWFMIKATDR